MRSFEDVSTTIRETTLVVSASLTFIILLWVAVVIRSVIQLGNLLNPLFLSGFVLFSIFCFFMLEIAGRFGFIGEGLKFGAAGVRERESAFLLLMDSVTAFIEPIIDVYTDWSMDALKEHIAKNHPVD